MATRVGVLAGGLLVVELGCGATSAPEDVAGAESNLGPDAAAPVGPAGGDPLAGCAPRPASPSAGPANAEPLYPAPRFASMGLLEARTKNVCVDTTALPEHAHLDALLPELAGDAGLSVVPVDCNCNYRIVFQRQPPLLGGAAAKTWMDAGTNPERYVVRSATDAGRARAKLFAETERGALYALRAAMALVQTPAGSADARVADATIVDYPTIARRGVVEGVYNPAACSMLDLPWRVGERRAAIRLVSQLRGNAYLYSPKCDPYARDRWRDPYPPGSSDELVIRVALHEAERQMLELVWALSPGVDGLAAVDLPSVKAKIDAMRAIGVRHFGLFLDDIDDHAPAPQIALINAVDDYLRKTAPNERLLVVGTTYCGHSGNFDNCEGPNAYTDRLGAELHPTVDLMWTGEDVIPSTMTASDMTAINASFQRRVTIWDNWPDVATGFRGRAGDLGGAVKGYFSNPLLSERGHPIGDYFRVMGPIFDYLWMTERYAANASYAKWQPRLAADDDANACEPCGDLPDGWTCDADDTHSVLFCDPDTGCLSSHACPGGCVVGAPGVEDVCH